MCDRYLILAHVPRYTKFYASLFWRALQQNARLIFAIFNNVVEYFRRHGAPNGKIITWVFFDSIHWARRRIYGHYPRRVSAVYFYADPVNDYRCI